MTKKILHLGKSDKFLLPFIKFLKKNKMFDEHEFLLSAGVSGEEFATDKNIQISATTLLAKLKHYLKAFKKMHQAEKIILHGLFDMRLVQILFLSPWLLQKCHWFVQGGDLYIYNLGKRNWKWSVNEFFRRPVIKYIGHMVTYIEGDIELARKWYSAKGKYHECLMYPSNLYTGYDVDCDNKREINIQVGNSADPSNNHFAVFKMLLPFKEKNIRIYVPLSYGPSEYARNVIEQGRELFGNKFRPLTKMLPFDEYVQFLSRTDIAIFNHHRQQAMGNTITLLGLGKTVYIRSDTTQWKFLKDKGISIGDIEKLDSLERLDKNANIKLIERYFSRDNYLGQLKRLFD